MVHDPSEFDCIDEHSIDELDGIDLIVFDEEQASLFKDDFFKEDDTVDVVVLDVLDMLDVPDVPY